MRIIAGRLKGRTIVSPHGHRTHPMGDRVRGALFNVLGDIEGLRVADIFSGSGALALEAISRGANHVVAVESDHQAQTAIIANINALAIEDNRLRLIKSSVSAWLATTKDVFDLILIDPPYDDLQEPLLGSLALHIKKGGLMVLSWPPDTILPTFDVLQLVSHKTYGDAGLAFYRSIA